MNDTELALRILLFIAAMCCVISAGMVVALAYLLGYAKHLRRLRRGPEVLRDWNGRRIKERM